jgi:hypothetical protein
MNAMIPYLQVAGLVQLLIAATNFVLPGKLRYRENLSRVDPIIRQVFVTHSAYIVFVLLAFAALCFLFPGELAGASSLGRFLSGWMALFWMPRLIVQWTYYDADVRRANPWGNWGFTAAIVYLIVVFGVAAWGGVE